MNFKIIFPSVFGFIVGIFLLGSCSIIQPGHRGVVVTLGKVSTEIKGEGITGKLPFVTSIHQVSIQQTTEGGSAEAFSSDLQTIKVQFKCLYRLPEEKVGILFQQYRGDVYEALIEPRIQEELKQVTALYTADTLVKSREKIKAKVLEKVKAVVGDLAFIQDIVIVNIDLTDELEKAIELKTVKQQEALAKVFDLQKAQRDSAITMVKAHAEANAIQANGEMLKQYPGVVDLEIVKKWDGKSPTTIVENKGGANVVLPLK